MRECRGSATHTEAARFVIRTAEVLHALGTPAHRLEAALARLARVIGVRAQVFSSPTSLLLAFGSGARQRTVLRRVEPGEVNLGKLVEIDEILDALEDGRIDLRVARHRIEAVVSAPARHGPVKVLVAHALASACAATMFGGSAPEVLAAVAVGCALGLLAGAFRRAGHALGLFEPTAAMVATLIAAALAGVVPVRDHVVVVAGIIVLVPGLSFTVAMIELTTRHLMSGTARLAGAATVFVTISFGVAIGRGVASLAWARPTLGDPDPLPPWASFVAIPIAAWSFGVLFEARTRELGWIFLAAAFGFVSVRITEPALGSMMASFAGALAVGLVSNIFARLRDRPASVPLTPGLLVLVPGSIGYRALDLFLARDPAAGMQTAFEMVIAATSLVAGLLCASLLVAPRRSL